MMRALLYIGLGAGAGWCIAHAQAWWKMRAPIDQEIVRQLRERGMM